MWKLKIICTRFKKFCNYNTLGNSRDWLKVIRVKLKFGASMSSKLQNFKQHFERSCLKAQPTFPKGGRTVLFPRNFS